MKTKSIQLTTMEGKILLELCNGRSPRFIMETLVLTDAAFRVHQSHIRTKIKGGWSYETQEPKPPLPITPMQRKVLALRAEGKNHPSIANELGISISTSYIHASLGMRRLNLTCRHGRALAPLRKALESMEKEENV